jgi:hypothetical protein
MDWRAEIVSEPSQNHKLCVDLFEDGVHRARVRCNERLEMELVCYQGDFTIPADWLVGIIQRFVADTGSKRGGNGP